MFSPAPLPARRRLLQGTAGIVLLLALASAFGHDNHAGHAAPAGLARSEHQFALPAVKVTRADGKRMTLKEALDDGRPVVLNFIYTSCNSICPVTSQVFVELRERLGAERDRVNMVSISIDPEQDSPGQLTAYAQRFGAQGVWSHYTSANADAIEIQRAFGAWRGDKMNHQPSTYLRAAPGKPWVRLDGFYSPSALAQEFRKTTVAVSADGCADGTSPTTQTAGSTVGKNLRCKS